MTQNSRPTAILYATTANLAHDYLTAHNLNPNNFRIITRPGFLLQAIRGTTGMRVLILGDKPIAMDTVACLRARDAIIERVSY